MTTPYQRISYRIKAYPRMQKKTGKHPFGLQIVINGDARMLPIDVVWFAADFDTKTETFKHNAQHPEVVRDLNLIIGKEKSRANDILTRYRLRNQPITLKQFRWEFSNYTSRENIHEWLELRADKLLADGEVTLASRKTYRTKFLRLKNYHPDPISFAEIDKTFIIKFDLWLRSSLAYNTAVGTHKTFSKFFTLAVKEGMIHQSPYHDNDKIVKKYADGDRDCLEPDEVERLIALLKDRNKLTETQLNVLEMFVFSCTSGGYRFSELIILHSNNIKNGEVRLYTPKGGRTGVNLKVPLPEIGLKLIEGRKGKIFKAVAEPVANRTLKTLASMAQISKSISFHSARDTFGTLYTYYGGDIVTLSKEIFRHHSIDTTMIYQKKSERMKKEGMKNFDVFKLP